MEAPSVPAQAQRQVCGLSQAEELKKKPAPTDGLYFAGLELPHLPPAQGHRRTQPEKAAAQHQARTRKGGYGSH